MKRLLRLVALALGCALPLAAQVHPPINQPVFRAFDSNGAPLVGGLLYTYAAGTSTPLATYSDAGAVTANANPVVLDASGSAKIFLGFSSYKFVLTDANGVQQWTVDNINGAPPTGAITSIFGRTGAVVAVTGDYTCSQVTGAVCSIPTLYYQTVMANNSAISPQRPKINYIGGVGVSVSCVDNSTTSSTDCTFATQGGPSTPRTCNANGCYRVEADGTIEAWGQVTVPPSNTAFNTASITFPTNFTVNPSVTLTTIGVIGTADTTTPPAVELQSESTSGASAYMAAVIVASAGGTTFSNTITLNWYAVGH